MFESYYFQRVKQMEDLRKARMFKALFGTFVAAQFMRFHGWSIEAALYNLLGIGVRDQRSSR